MKVVKAFSGLGAFLLTIGAFLVPGETPDLDAPAAEVVAFYSDHESEMIIAGLMLMIAAFLVVVFASTIAGALRRAQGESGGASAISFGGGIILAVGISIFAGINFVLGDAADNLEPAAVQTFHVMNQDFFAPFSVGMLTFLVGTGAGILKTDVLPKWLGWVAIVGGILGVTPAFPGTAIALLILFIVGGARLARADA